MSGGPWSQELIARLLDSFPGIFVGCKNSSDDQDYGLTLTRQFVGFSVFPGNELSLALEGGREYAGCISASVNVDSRLASEVWFQVQSTGAAEPDSLPRSGHVVPGRRLGQEPAGVDNRRCPVGAGAAAAVAAVGKAAATAGCRYENHPRRDRSGLIERALGAGRLGCFAGAGAAGGAAQQAVEDVLLSDPPDGLAALFHGQFLDAVDKL